MPEQRGNGTGDNRQQDGVTRRQALQLGAVTAGLVALDTTPASAETEAAKPARERSFDEGWRFFRGEAAGAQAPSIDDSAWRRLDLPHDWSIEDLPYTTSTNGAASADPSIIAPETPPTYPGLPDVIGPFDPARSENGGSIGYTVGGIGWYRKEFRLSGDSHVELRFDGVYQNADIWLNGTHLGFHPYGYTSFAYDLTPHLDRDGVNVLAVRVDNTGRNSRWYAGSGIYRHTWLTETGPVRIPLWGVSVTTPVVAENSVARVAVSVANRRTESIRSTVPLCAWWCAIRAGTSSPPGTRRHRTSRPPPPPRRPWICGSRARSSGRWTRRTSTPHARTCWCAARSSTRSPPRSASGRSSGTVRPASCSTVSRSRSWAGTCTTTTVRWVPSRWTGPRSAGSRS
jgi:hypothetical protein